MFGMIPVLIATSDGAEWRNVMGGIIIGGLASSTFLTLFVVPAAYSLVDSIGTHLGKIVGLFRRKFLRQQTVPED